MKAFRLSAVLVLLALVSMPAIRSAVAQDEEKAATDTPLAKEMEKMEEATKTLRRSLKDPAQNEKSLELVAKLQAASMACKEMTPVLAAKQPEADRAKFTQNYRKDMAKFIAATCEMEIALLDGNNEKAQEIYKALLTAEDEGHEKYTAQE